MMNGLSQLPGKGYSSFQTKFWYSMVLQDMQGNSLPASALFNEINKTLYFLESLSTRTTPVELPHDNGNDLEWLENYIFSYNPAEVLQILYLLLGGINEKMTVLDDLFAKVPVTDSSYDDNYLLTTEEESQIRQELLDHYKKKLSYYDEKLSSFFRRIEDSIALSSTFQTDWHQAEVAILLLYLQQEKVIIDNDRVVAKYFSALTGKKSEPLRQLLSWDKVYNYATKEFCTPMNHLIPSLERILEDLTKKNKKARK